MAPEPEKDLNEKNPPPLDEDDIALLKTYVSSLLPLLHLSIYLSSSASAAAAASVSTILIFIFVLILILVTVALVISDHLLLLMRRFPYVSLYLSRLFVMIPLPVLACVGPRTLCYIHQEGREGNQRHGKES
jgi:hypothetical protein